MPNNTGVIGSVNNTVRISSINFDTNTITLETAKTWNTGDPIWLYKDSAGNVVLNGAAPDLRPHEFSGTPIAAASVSIYQGNVLHIRKGNTEESNTAEITATVSPANATYRRLVWTSSDPSIVSVNTDGIIPKRQSPPATKQREWL